MRGRSPGKAEEAEPKKVVDMNEKIHVFGGLCHLLFEFLFLAMPQDVLSVWILLVLV